MKVGWIIVILYFAKAALLIGYSQGADWILWILCVGNLINFHNSLLQGLKCYQCHYFEYNMSRPSGVNQTWEQWAGDAKCWNENTTRNVSTVELQPSKGMFVCTWKFTENLEEVELSKCADNLGKKVYCFVFNARGLNQQSQRRIVIIRDVIQDHRTNLGGHCESTTRNTTIGSQCYCTSDHCNHFNNTNAASTFHNIHSLFYYPFSLTFTNFLAFKSRNS